MLPTSEASAPAHYELRSRPLKAAPRRRQLFSVCCFSPCLLDVRSLLRWLLRGVRLNRTTQSPTSCWYSCLPWGLTTAPEERGQRSGSGPWHWPSSPFTSLWTGEVVALTAEQLSPVPVLLVPSYWPVFSDWTLIICLLRGRLFDPESPLNAVLEPMPTCDRSQSWGGSPEIWTHLTLLLLLTETRLRQEWIQLHLGRFHRALSPVKHNTQDHPSAEEALSISHTWRKVWVTAHFQ